MQPTRLTLFVLVHLIAVLFGAIVGGAVGFTKFGAIGAVVGAVLGFLAGCFIGSLPTWLTRRWMFRSIEKSSSAELKADLERGQWNFFHTMSLLQLAARNEDVQPYLPRIVKMLESDETLARVYGWDALRIVFTELSRRIEDYDPRGPVEECRRKVALLASRDAESTGPRIVG